MGGWTQSDTCTWTIAYALAMFFKLRVGLVDIDLWSLDGEGCLFGGRQVYRANASIN